MAAFFQKLVLGRAPVHLVEIPATQCTAAADAYASICQRAVCRNWRLVASLRVTNFSFINLLLLHPLDGCFPADVVLARPCWVARSDKRLRSVGGTGSLGAAASRGRARIPACKCRLPGSATAVPQPGRRWCMKQPLASPLFCSAAKTPAGITEGCVVCFGVWWAIALACPLLLVPHCVILDRSSCKPLCVIGVIGVTSVRSFLPSRPSSTSRWWISSRTVHEQAATGSTGLKRPRGAPAAWIVQTICAAVVDRVD